MGITGNLKTMELTELLQWLSQGQKTGTLVVVHNDIAKKIYFKGGLIMSSASSDPKEYLGQFLVGYNFITEEQLVEAISRQEGEKKLLGSILVDMGTISAEDLDQMLRLKAQETIYSLFEWDEGEFKFLDNELPKYQLVSISIDVTGLILEGMRRLDEINRMRKVIPSGDAVPVVISEEKLLSDPDLDETGRYILQAINDDRTVSEIALETRALEYNVNEAIFKAQQKGFIKVVRARIRIVVERIVERVEVPTAAPTPPPPQQAPPAQPPYNYAEQPPQAPPNYAHQYAPSPQAPPPQAAPTPAPTVSPAASLVQQADQALSRRRWFDAVTHLRNACNLEPSNQAIAARSREVEAKIHSDLRRAGIVDKAIPQLNVSFEELTKLDASPKAGFILSRVDGSYDVQSILKISPMSPLEAKLVILELLEGGQVRLS